MLRGFSTIFPFVFLIGPAAAQAPLPPPRPAGIENTLPSAPNTNPSPANTNPLPAGAPADVGEDADACAARLAKLGIKAEPAPPLRNGDCGARSPVRLIELPNGVEISPPATLTCAAAEALGKWGIETVVPEAERHLGAAPSKVLIGTSYECRSRNRQPGAKLSEHAFANAVDVMGFAFSKRRSMPISTRFDETPEAMFLGAVRAGACAYFTTVLGPGSDAAHGDHLHLDMRERKRGAKLCQ